MVQRRFIHNLLFLSRILPWCPAFVFLFLYLSLYHLSHCFKSYNLNISHSTDQLPSLCVGLLFGCCCWGGENEGRSLFCVVCILLVFVCLLFTEHGGMCQFSTWLSEKLAFISSVGLLENSSVSIAIANKKQPFPLRYMLISYIFTLRHTSTKTS